MEDEESIESQGSSERLRLSRLPKVKPPFQLCFAPAQELGESDLSKPKLPRGACIITPKFYSKQDALTIEEGNSVQQVIDEIDKMRMFGRLAHDVEPVLESQSYGWYTEPLVPMDKNDRRFQHHRVTSEMVKIQSILYNAHRADKFFEHSSKSRMAK